MRFLKPHPSRFQRAQPGRVEIVRDTVFPDGFAMTDRCRQRGGAVLVAAALLGGALVTPGCSPIELLNRAVPDEGYRVQSSLAYGPEPRHRLDAYTPVRANATSAPGARPLVVFFYGGTWSHGARADFRFVGAALAAQGAVVLVPDYGLAPRFTYPTFVQDSARAVAWALDHAAQLGADPQRVFVMGHSSGAYNASMVALDARWLDAFGASPKQLAGWIGLAGPYDFLPIKNAEAQTAFNWPATPPDSQPLAHVSAAAPATLLLAAAHDDVVDPERNSARMAERLRTAGVTVQLRYFDDLGHVTLIAAIAAPLRWLGGPVLPPILDFIGLPRSVE